MNQAIIEAKKAYVAEIAEKMKNAESTVVVEYRGLTVAGNDGAAPRAARRRR